MSSGAVKIHNRWDAGKKAMVYCEGSLRYPKKDVFRSYVSRLWAEDWDSPEDSVYDE